MALLSGQTLAGARVYGNRVRDLWDETMPCILVWTKDEPSEIYNSAPLEMKRTLRVVVEIITVVDDRVDDAMDDIAEVVENILANNPRLDELAGDCLLSSTDFDIDSTGEKLVGSTKITWDVPYFKYMPEAQELDDLKTMNVKVDRSPMDGNIEIEGNAYSWNNSLSSLFRGSNFVSVPDSESWNVGKKFSISLWVKPDNVTDPMVFVAHHNSSGVKAGFGFGLGIVTPGQLGFYSSSTVGTDYTEDSGSPLVADTWQHVAVTFDGINARFYLNGALNSELSRSELVGDSSNPLRIGSDTNQPAGNFFVGTINNLALWGVKLTAAQIAEIYNSGEPADLAIHSANESLIAWYRLGDGDSVHEAIDSEAEHHGSKEGFEATDTVSDVP